MERREPRNPEHDDDVAAITPAVKRLPDLLILHALQQQLRVIRNVPASRVLNLLGKPPHPGFDVFIDDLPVTGVNQVVETFEKQKHQNLKRRLIADTPRLPIGCSTVIE